MARKKGPKKQPKGDHKVGYCRPPEHGKIKRGEVRNPHGRTGKPPPDVDDPYAFAASQRMKISIGGEEIEVTAEAGMYLKHFAVAMGGGVGSFKALAEESRARRKRPEVPAPEDLVASAREAEQRRALAARLVELLEEEAARKKSLHFHLPPQAEEGGAPGQGG